MKIKSLTGTSSKTQNSKELDSVKWELPQALQCIHSDWTSDSPCKPIEPFYLKYIFQLTEDWLQIDGSLVDMWNCARVSVFSALFCFYITVG